MATTMEATAGMSNMLQFMKLIGQLKRVPRTGWVYRNVQKPESVSDHMYRMAVMSLTITDPTVDKSRCIKLALVHDMAECIVGDIAPPDNISKAEKHRREEASLTSPYEAMRHLASLLPEGLQQEMYGLWEEYETQSSPEAQLVKQFDLLEMILQAHDEEIGELGRVFTASHGAALLLTAPHAGASGALTQPLGAVRHVVGGRVLSAGVRRGGEDLLEAASSSSSSSSSCFRPANLRLRGRRK
ncbi:HD domain-containing protein 2 [Liparis tanakae]|uniref:5'-deoxynucleotidase HDDC2 n=1 Tax=Liparis tanakae TaxID=230148 RepID=A0A4Z2F3L5_9TELE|nr:HD domain-containing protein 2 [Liparis tanakae]